MPDRNGTIKRLQDSLKVVNGWCCRTDSLDDPIMNVERAMEDALELLKGQEARVLTKDEANEAEVTWLEVRGNEPYATLYANTFKPESYGKYYRCWNYKPTDEQRKAVKWDD